MAGKSNSNNLSADEEAIKAFVDRWFVVEKEQQENKAQYSETKADFKQEIKDRFDELGITFTHIADQVAIRLDEHKAQENQDRVNAAHTMYGKLFGFAPPAEEPAPADDDDALG